MLKNKLETFQVKSWLTRKVIYKAEAKSYKSFLETAVKKGVDLTGVILRGKDLSGFNLSKGKFFAADFRRCKLKGTKFKKAEIDKANFAGIEE